MSKSHRVDAYPSDYLTLAAEFEGDRPKRERVLTLPTKAAATTLRLDLYGFRRALTGERLAADYPNFMLCRIFVEGRRIRIKHVDDCSPLRRKSK